MQRIRLVLCVRIFQMIMGVKLAKISVIIPCYNVEDFVARCLDSLLKQTLSDIEIICVDDKSTDNTLKILKQYAKQDKRIKVIVHKENSGVSVARNNGIDAAGSDYLCVVDPDDYVDADFYEKLYNKITSTNADVAHGSVIATNLVTNASWTVVYKPGKKYIFAHWTGLYRRKFLKENNIRYNPELKYSEDTLFITEVVLKTRKIEYVKDAYYHYFYLRTNSLDSQSLSHSKAMSLLKSWNIKVRLIQDANLSSRDTNDFLIQVVAKSVASVIKFKDFENSQDTLDVFKFMVMLYNKYNVKKYFKKEFGSVRCKSIKRENFDAFMSYEKQRLYLFGFLPLVKIEKMQSVRYIKLFEIIPLFKLK